MTPITYPRIPLKEMDATSLVFELSREVSRVITDAEQRAVVDAAAMLATHLHRHQTRRVRGDLPRVPYIEHPIRNALRLIRFGKTDYRLIAAALLHDVIEDCSDEIAATLAAGIDLPFHVRLDTKRGRREAALIWLAEVFGDHVAGVVEKVSHKVAARREDYLPSIETLAAAAVGTVFDPWAVDALLVKTSDLLDNAGSLRHQLAAGEDEDVIRRRAEKYLPAVVLVADTLADLGEHEIATTLDELEEHLRVIVD